MSELYECKQCGEKYPIVSYIDPLPFDQKYGNWGAIRTAIVFTQNKVGCCHSDRTERIYHAYAEAIGEWDIRKAIRFTLDQPWNLTKEAVDQDRLTEELYHAYVSTTVQFSTEMKTRFRTEEL